MTGRTLLVVGIVWLAVVSLWLCLSPGFSHTWVLPKGGFKRVVIVAAFSVAAASYTLFLVGWIVPISAGIYRLIAKR